MNIKYFSVNRIIGLLSMLLFIVMVTFSGYLNFVPGFIFFILGTIISCISFFILNKSISLSEDGCWLILAVFVVLMALCRLFLNWDFHLPFFISGLIAMACSSAVSIIRNTNIKNPQPAKSFQAAFFKWFDLIKLFATVFVVLILIICVCVFAGVMV